ncbi:BTAD domain-containing putative transcriptional regulator [Fodinicola feengrottensis]|uniref:BTAD domain-containing putative transcriptional regulator n=1 Tax=Fodinicola feengrottensis TaxID=435914 RepID=UPI002443252E|nr:BTAD domain-containing putative transcriptional regulator [Fodinicola feengrottensis]
MLARYRDGRQAAALAAYDQARAISADELGLDPGPMLTELRQRILAGDPTLSRPVPALVAVAPPPRPGSNALFRATPGISSAGTPRSRRSCGWPPSHLRMHRRCARSTGWAEWARPAWPSTSPSGSPAGSRTPSFTWICMLTPPAHGR